MKQNALKLNVNTFALTKCGQKICCRRYNLTKIFKIVVFDDIFLKIMTAKFEQRIRVQQAKIHQK